MLGVVDVVFEKKCDRKHISDLSMHKEEKRETKNNIEGFGSDNSIDVEIFFKI